MSSASDFIIEDGKLKRYMGTDTDVVIPAGVTSIGGYAFRRNRRILSAVLPDSVTKIEDGAFMDCTALQRVNIPEQVTHIGAEAFRNCRNLQEVSSVGTPQKIGCLAFYGCWKINDAPETIQQFLDRMRAGSMTMEEGEKLYEFSKSKGVITIKEFANISLVVGENGKNQYAFTSHEDTVIIPTTIGDLPVAKAPCKRIPEDAVVYCAEEFFDKLNRSSRAAIAATWLAGDKMLGDGLADKIQVFIKKYSEDVAYALQSCDLAEAYQRFVDLVAPKAELMEKMVEAAQGKTEILAVLLNAKQNQAVKNGSDDDLSLDAPKKMSVAELKKLWTYTTFTDAATGEKCAEITNYKGHDKHVEIPAYIGKTKVTRISGVFPVEVESAAFQSEDIEIKCSFRNCKKMADENGFIMISAGGRRVLTDYIGKKNIKELYIPEGVTENTYGTFQAVEVRKVVFPEGFEVLANGTFADCRKLQQVVLPDTLREIGQRAFSGCTALKNLYIPAGVQELPYIGIGDARDKSAVIYGNARSSAAVYAEKNGLKFVEGKIPESGTLPDFLVTNGILTHYLGDEKDIAVPYDVVSIAVNAFKGNTRIRSVVLPEGIEKIDAFTFGSCSALESVTLPGSLREIGEYAFQGCTALQTINIPDYVMVIGKSAFDCCRALSSVDLPDGLMSIGEKAFSACFALKEIHIPVGVNAIGSYAFQTFMNQQKTVIFAAAGSYAETYARENNIIFVAE